MQSVKLGSTFRSLLLSLFLLVSCAAYAQNATDIKVYVLDGGHLYFKNMGIFYDTGEHNGEPGEMVVPCYLIRHGNTWLLWDTGNGDDIAAYPKGVHKIGIQFAVTRTLKSQLAVLGLKPSDISLVALSHLHPDHSGNIRLFPDAKFLISENEFKWAMSIPTPESVQASLVKPLKTAKVIALKGDTDVFGDGTVRIIRTPGHTPGHQSLILKLPSGYVAITGDLYHTKENQANKQVDAGNFNRADELASFDRFDKMVKNLGAKVIIQHNPADFESLPKFPNFLQ